MRDLCINKLIKWDPHVWLTSLIFVTYIQFFMQHSYTSHVSYCICLLNQFNSLEYLLDAIILIQHMSAKFSGVVNALRKGGRVTQTNK